MHVRPHRYSRLGTTALLSCLALLWACGDDPLETGPAEITPTFIPAPSGSGVAPTFVDGNPSCQDLGYAFGFKIEGQGANDYTGTFTFTSTDGILTGTAPEDPNNSVTVTSPDGIVFDWTATLGIDAVIVKGGPDANAYVYDPPEESTGDTGLQSPTNNGGTPAISHIEFCYDYELAAEKTAETGYTRTYTWDIDKTAHPDAHVGFLGSTFESLYTVAVDQTLVDSEFAVTGTVTVTNPSPLAVEFSVADVLSYMGGSTEATVTCPASVPASGSVECTYEASLNEAFDGTNTATVTSATDGVDGATASVDYAFGDPTNIVGFPDVSVTDTNGQAWAAGGDDSWTYEGVFACPTDQSLYTDGVYTKSFPNTAEITETDQTADANVDLTCYALVVSKDANATWTRTYDWTIQKDVSPASHSGTPGESFSSDYTVSVDQTITDGPFEVSGTITIVNPSPDLTVDVSIEDVVGGVAATLDCSGTLAVGPGSNTCGYEATLPDKVDGTNTATITLLGAEGGSSFEATADYAFGADPDFVNGDPTIDVSDVFDGGPGEALFSASGDYTFPYSREFVCSSEAGDYANGAYTQTFVNTATIDGSQLSDSESVDLTCTPFDLTAAKTAAGSYDQRLLWEIEKTVTPDGSLTAFAGEDIGWTWTVTPIQNGSVDENFLVEGAITVSNENPFPVDFTVGDVLSDGTVATVDCDASTVPGDGSVDCTYTAVPDDASATLNTATIISQTSGINGAIATADVSFTATQTNTQATVTDDQGPLNELVQVGALSSFDLPDGITCSTDAGAYADGGSYSETEYNTATITFGGGSDSDDADITYTCEARPLSAEKTASASYDEVHSWTLEKSVNPTFQSGYPGDDLSWTWTVDVSESFVESNFAVTGTITVANANPFAVDFDVMDVLDDLTEGAVTCPVYTVPGGGSVTCEYLASPSGRTATLNTATVEPTTLGITGATATAPVDFVANVLNGTADLSDLQIGLVETLTAGAGPWSFPGTEGVQCSYDAAQYGADGTYGDTELNTATLTVGGAELTADATTAWLCEAAFVDVLKTTNGVVNPDKSWSFALYDGPDGFEGTQVGNTSSTSGDLDGILDFGDPVPALSPIQTYTVCELAVPAAWTAEWQTGGVNVIAYNPDADEDPPEDLGNRCIDFGADTGFGLSTGTTLSFLVDNSFPGGDPRTPGYWKNWNRVTGGGQQYTADQNGGAAEGYWLVEDVLNSPVQIGTELLGPGDAAIVVDILDKRRVEDEATVGDGRKVASDPLHNLAAHLMAYLLNQGAGAGCGTDEVMQAAADAQQLLVDYNFDGTDHDNLRRNSDDGKLANDLAALIDAYNNGQFCGS